MNNAKQRSNSTRQRISIQMRIVVVLTTIVLSILSNNANADIVVREFQTPQQEAQYQALINDFRCPTCQNQNLAGSDAPIAQDLKQKTYEMVKVGRSDSEIRQYMFERYGDFISYKPPVRPSTWILWFFPPLLLVTLLIAWVVVQSKKRARLLAQSKRNDASTNAALQDSASSPNNNPSNEPLTAAEERELAALLAAHRSDMLRQ